ncbi:MAG: hypothetical protein QF662_03555 [Phycisphaerae bacterium]|nr:hypothetical protein [Phycisphaerae bacterium]
MKALNRWLIIVGLAGLLGLAASAASGQELGASDDALEEGNAGIFEDAAETEPEFPYVGELTGDNVRIRSGPGTYFYPLAELKLGEKIIVEAKKWRWLAIRPVGNTAGLIAKDKVERAGEGTVAKVSAEKARVYASSPTSKRRWAVMVILKADDEVRILGEEGDFFRISAPEGAKVYISADFVKRVGPYPEAWTAAPPVRVDVEKLKADPEEENFTKLEASLNKELAKPLMERKMAPLATSYASVAEKAKAGYLKRLAKRRVALIESQVKLQENYRDISALGKALDKKLDDIDKAKGKSITPIEWLSKTYDGWGTVERVVVAEGTEWPIKFKLIGDNGRISLLLRSAEVDLAKLVGKKVGLKGKKSYHGKWRIYILDVESAEPIKVPAAAGKKK